RLDQRGDGQAVPGGDDLVVAVRLRSLATGFEQRDPGAVVARLVLRGRVGEHLEYRRAVLERALLSDMEELGGPCAVLLADDVTQLRRRPGVGQAFDAFGVGVERRGEAALCGAQRGQ